MQLGTARHHLLIITALLGMAASALPARGAKIYVSPDGDDRWSGQLAEPNDEAADGPVASLAGARDAVRRLKTQDDFDETVHVEIAAGTYTLNEPVIFTPEDSGTGMCPVIYQAASGARPVFTGGRVITGFVADAKGVWSVKLPWAAGATGPDDVCNKLTPEVVHDPTQRFEQLWVNGRRATRARSPNKLYYFMADGVKDMINPLTGRKEHLGRRAFVARRADIEALFDIPADRLSDVAIMGYYSWDAACYRVGHVNSKTNVIVTTGEAPFLFWQTGRHRRYHIENFKAALDAPGEWFLARDGTLYYIPREGEEISETTAVAPWPCPKTRTVLALPMVAVVTAVMSFLPPPTTESGADHFQVPGKRTGSKRHPED